MSNGLRRVLLFVSLLPLYVFIHWFIAFMCNIIISPAVKHPSWANKRDCPNVTHPVHPGSQWEVRNSVHIVSTCVCTMTNIDDNISSKSVDCRQKVHPLSQSPRGSHVTGQSPASPPGMHGAPQRATGDPTPPPHASRRAQLMDHRDG